MLPRYFVEAEHIATEPRRCVFIEGDDAHHITRVLRLRMGDQVWVSDGMGHEYLGTIADLAGTRVRVDLDAPKPAKGEPFRHITLFQGLPKSDKMDWIVQKAAEIGISAIVPIAMDRSVVSLSAAKAVERIRRWQRIAESAAQQAARGRVPEVMEMSSLGDAIGRWQPSTPGLLLVPWEEEHALGLKALLRGHPVIPEHIGIVIGPEGGLTDNEIQICSQLGGRSCSLGPRILRTETAGVVVAALVLYELDEMGS